MRLTLLAITLSALAASTFAADYYITTPEGYNVSSFGADIHVGAGAQAWALDQLSADLRKNWHVIHQGEFHVRFPSFKEGEYAWRTDTPVIYRMEEDAGYFYLIPLETDKPENRLAWTVEGAQSASLTYPLWLRLRAYTRAPNQRFRFTKITT
ncbi:hypothetical protein FQN49_006271 [Arthroderma sp. PD_2]|nr:hypothetical protein FQN49_006271 [Arthroderma sp. PD_2]